MASTQQLLDEINELEKQKEELEKEIKDYVEKEDFAVACGMCRHIKDNLFYRRFPMESIDSVFWTRRDILLPLVSATMQEECIREIKYGYIKQKYDNHYIYVACICDGIIYSQKGPVLVLHDPYKKFISKALEKQPHDIETWIGRMLVLKMILEDNPTKQTEFKVVGVKKLRFTEFGEMVNNEERSIRNEKDNSVFKELSEANNYHDCMKELVRFQHITSRYGYTSKFDSRHPNVLIMRGHIRTLGVMAREDHLELSYIEQDKFDKLADFESEESVHKMFIDNVNKKLRERGQEQKTIKYREVCYELPDKLEKLLSHKRK